MIMVSSEMSSRKDLALRVFVFPHLFVVIDLSRTRGLNLLFPLETPWQKSPEYSKA